MLEYCQVISSFIFYDKYMFNAELSTSHLKNVLEESHLRHSTDDGLELSADDHDEFVNTINETQELISQPAPLPERRIA